jgi:hypothetical protein
MAGDYIPEHLQSSVRTQVRELWRRRQLVATMARVVRSLQVLWLGEAADGAGAGGSKQKSRSKKKVVGV